MISFISVLDVEQNKGIIDRVSRKVELLLDQN